MKSRLLLLLFILQGAYALSQADSFDVFTYTTPDFFTKADTRSEVRFRLSNEDGSFCTITLYKSRPAGTDILHDITTQWKVVRQLPKADKKPLKILTEQFWDGWASTLAIGNFYHNKKKAVVLLYSFRKNNTTAFAVFAFTDKIFKGPVESFSKNLHLNTTQQK
jgi:hypothetical protein